MRVGVLALQGDVSHHLALLREACRQDESVTSVRRPEELERVDALVIPGGESSVIDKLSRRADLYEPIRERIESGMPCFGTCAGMILLSERVEGAIEGQDAFGGLDITVRRNAFGRQVDSFEVGLPITGVTDDGPDFPAVFIRAPWAHEIGPGVQVLATVSSAEGVPRVVAAQAGALLATSFHPELSGDSRLHEHFLGLARAADTPDRRLRRAQSV